MKNILLLLIISLAWLKSSAQTDSLVQQQYELTGKITGTIMKSPPCGIFAFAVVISFEIESITGLDYKGKTIHIIFTCPEFYAPGLLKEGRRYRVVFNNSSVVDFTILNKDLLKKNRLSFEPVVSYITPATIIN